MDFVNSGRKVEKYIFLSLEVMKKFDVVKLFVNISLGK